jgi:hypothetical protein
MKHLMFRALPNREVGSRVVNFQPALFPASENPCTKLRTIVFAEEKAKQSKALMEGYTHQTMQLMHNPQASQIATILKLGSILGENATGFELLLCGAEYLSLEIFAFSLIYTTRRTGLLGDSNTYQETVPRRN